MANTAGFSLIELIIVVTIIGILSAVAYPSYLQHVERSNRNDARAALNVVANDLERFFATNGTYTTDMSATSLDSGHSEHGKYQLSIAAGSTGSIASSYTVSATAIGGQANDEDCPVLTLDSTGSRTPDPETTPCW